VEKGSFAAAMNRERLEVGWYAVRPFLFYMILFITIRAVLYRALESVLLSMSADMALYYEIWSEITDLLILGISSAGAAVPFLKEGRREIMLARRSANRAWITRRRDGGMLIGILPFGTICLAAFLNLLLARQTAGAAVRLTPAAVPLGAAVYGILTPFIEEMIFRGIVWHRLRRGFSPLQAALISAALFGAAHENIPQGIYAFVMGMVFALGYEVTRRFEVPFLLHCTCNLAVLAASSAGWGEILSQPVWIIFFAIGSAAVFGYWARRLIETKFKL
jgi:membrane protease YdiL (CAAX protease family)